MITKQQSFMNSKANTQYLWKNDQAKMHDQKSCSDNTISFNGNLIVLEIDKNIAKELLAKYGFPTWCIYIFPGECYLIVLLGCRVQKMPSLFSKQQLHFCLTHQQKHVTSAENISLFCVIVRVRAEIVSIRQWIINITH